jgi:hypothetical protein
MLSIHPNRPIGLVALFTVLAWLGEYIHNLVELPQLTILSPENSLPALVFLLFFLGWWWLPYQRPTAILMLIYAALHLGGGAILSVIPFPFLPFYPEQSLRHYLAHVFYGVAQLPLMGLMLRQSQPPR